MMESSASADRKAEEARRAKYRALMDLIVEEVSALTIMIDKRKTLANDLARAAGIGFPYPGARKIAPPWVVHACGTIETRANLVGMARLKDGNWEGYRCDPMRTSFGRGSREWMRAHIDGVIVEEGWSLE